MKLTRLRLLGFKSFVEPTDFLIEPGLTGVVGPNGCGKSNLVEALRWVMGETSHKSLRAADMDDVIFSGTDNRPGAQQRRGRARARQLPTARRRRIQRARHARGLAPDRARRGLDLSHQRPRGARPRRAASCSPTPRPARARPRWCARAASARSSRPSPSSAGACWKRRPASPACTRAATRRSCGCGRPSTNLARLEDVIEAARAARSTALKRQARQAIRYRNRRRRDAQGRGDAASTCAGSPPMPSWPKPSAPRTRRSRVVAERTGEQAEAATRQALAAAALPALREAEARAARRPAAPRRIAREALDQRGSARRRAHGRARPPARATRRATSSASGGWPPTRRPRSRGSPPKRRRWRREDQSRRRTARGRATRRVARADAVAGARGKDRSPKLTAALADLDRAAQRAGRRRARASDRAARTRSKRNRRGRSASWRRSPPRRARIWRR